MWSYKKISTAAGWLVFAVAVIVYFFSAERSGSLWDCGEFILGAYKLQVVHPPGAPLFILIGRLFAWVGDVLSADPSRIAFAVNLMSGMATAFGAMFIGWTTIILGKLALVGRDAEPTMGQSLALGFAGVVGGLTTAFASSIWFSAVEGEVYALSTFFTCLTLWSTVKWYALPNDTNNDRWLIFALYSIGLSVGVHLLSLLIMPAMGLLYYFKKYEKHTITGGALSILAGLVGMYIIQKVIIVGIPTLWSWLELLMVNGLGLPVNSGLIPLILILGAAAYFGIRWANQRQNVLAQQLITALTLAVIAFSVFGVVIIRALANPPINMNEPTNAFRLISYLNREQYGERPLLKGPYFNARPIRYDRSDKYGEVNGKYEVVEQKYTPIYKESDEMFFPRMGFNDAARKQLYKMWMNKDKDTRPSFVDNIKFFLNYQVWWMYWRYFLWNFSGTQNRYQGYMPWDLRSGHWATGIKPIDEALLYNEDQLPDTMKNEPSRNSYYFLPVLFGLLGLLFHLRNNNRVFWTLFFLFITTGIGIIVYSNQPPNEPRERDYVLIGSFLTYAIWVGMGVLAIYDILSKRMGDKLVPAALSGALVLTAPVIMGFQNFDDHSRIHLAGARDYGANFLNSVAPNSIIFTFGDNDTYPLWYCQEVENIRPDVRVINLSLIAVDWYINQMRRKINESPPVKFTIPAEAYVGDARNQVFLDRGQPMEMTAALKYAGESHPKTISGFGQVPSTLPTPTMYLPINKEQALASGWVDQKDADRILPQLEVNLGTRQYITKDDLAVLDIIASNVRERPIYFAMTAQLDKLQGFQNNMYVDGIAARLVPINTGSVPRLNIYGVGEIHDDVVYDNIMNKFRWGNFDKYKQYVDGSFAPTTTVTRYVMMRTMEQFTKEGDTKRAADIAEKFFQAFPFMNFPYKGSEIYGITGTNFTLEMIKALVRDNRMEDAKKHMRLLAEETADYLDFYNSLSADDLQSFEQERNTSMMTVSQILAEVPNLNDPTFTQEMQNLLNSYKTTQIPN
ncbi:MAG: DUF2723 domain-containing protein [Saprospiraceae bacterium]|nr:DUF2723 domain-containing protein [Saprospiraceae bacterium]